MNNSQTRTKAGPERTTDTARDQQHQERCPECSGSLVRNAQQGETVCEDCGLVVEEDEIDPGPEWRAFDSAEHEQRSRVGAPVTTMMHDKGLSTSIGWENRDAYGNRLSNRKRKQIQRLRTWNERFRTRDAKERNLKQALGEINRMASALGLPETVRETASVIYRRALQEDLLPGRSIEGVASAALYAAARMAATPRSLDELARVSRVDRDELARAYRYIVRELRLEVQPADPGSYVPRFVSELGVSDDLERCAREMLTAAREQGLTSGKSPIGLAAAAIYAASLHTREPVTQREIADVSSVTAVTIRNRYGELVDLVSEDTETC
jgi:transcription initiation factor TFIIB